MSGTRASKAAQHADNMKHIMDNVFDEVDYVTETLASVGIKTLVDLVGSSKARLEKATFKDASGSEQPIEEKTFNHLWAFKKYVAFKDRFRDPDLRLLGDFTKVDPLDFLAFYTGIYDADTHDYVKEFLSQAEQDANHAYELKQLAAGNVTTTTPAVPAPTPAFQRKSLAEVFKQGIKRDANQFPTLKEIERYFDWHHKFTKVAKAQGVEDILDPKHAPTAGSPEEELFEEQKKFMDQVLELTFLCPEAKQILNDQRGTKSDPQAALVELKQIATTSVASTRRMTKILTELKSCNWTDTKVPGGARGYITHVNEKLVEYNNIANEDDAKLSDLGKRARMEEAVEHFPELNNVIQLESLLIAQDPNYVKDNNKFLSLLFQAADRYDVSATTQHQSKILQKKVFMHETATASSIESETDILHEFLAFKAARINADGNARMDGSTWHSLTPEDKAIWDTISESAKSTILKVAASPSPSSNKARQPPRRPPRRHAQTHEVETIVTDFVAYLHSVQQESEEDTEQTSDMSSQNDSALTEESNDFKAYLTKVLDKKTKPSDPRRMMSSALARNPPTKPATKQVITIDGEKFVREANMAVVSFSRQQVIEDDEFFDAHMELSCSDDNGNDKFFDSATESTVNNNIALTAFVRKVYRTLSSTYHHRLVEVSLRLREIFGSLVDRGANTTVAGNNCRVIAELLNVRADVTGLQNHQATNLKMGTIGYYAESSKGPCIPIIPQSVLLGTGTTIISAAQLEAHGVMVNDKSSVIGGKQYISTPDGYDFPIDIVNGLPYTPMRPFTDEEWDTLPHVFLGAADWNPRSLDCIISDKEGWHDAVSNPGADPRSSLFDMDGNYKLRHSVNLTEHVGDDEFFDALPYDTSDATSLDDMHTIADDCAFFNTCRINFVDTISHFPDYENDVKGTFAYATTRSQTRHGPPTLTPAVHDPPMGVDNNSIVTEPRLTEQQPFNYAALRPFFGWLPVDTIKRTFEATTQHARISGSTLLKRHFKSPFPALNVRRRNEFVATDFVYSDTPAIGTGDTIAAIFVGRTSKVTDAYGILTEKDFPATLEDNVRQRGAMDKLVSDRAKSTFSRRALDFLRYYCIDQWQSEPYHQNQNFAENRINDVKRITNILLDRTGTPAHVWLLCLTFVCFLLNNTAHPSLKWNTPLFTLTGQRNDISMLLCFVWFQPVYYKVYEKSFPSESQEARGRFVGISEHVGHRMTFKILTDDTQQIIYRSEVRSALDHTGTNLRIDTIFDGEVAQEFIKGISKAARDTILQEMEQAGDITTDERIGASIAPEPGEKINSSEIKESPTTQFVPTDLIGRTFLMDQRNDGQRHRTKIIEIVEAVEQHQNGFSEDKERIKFRVSIDNDKYEDVLSFSQIIDYIERKENNDSDPAWIYKKITAHQGPLLQSDLNYLGSMWNVMVESESGEINELPLSIVAAEDPVICALYASEKELLGLPGWKRFKSLAGRQEKLLRQVKQAKIRSYRTAPKYMYGYEVPRNYEHALTLDQQNRNTMWQDATEIEMKSLHEYNTFRDHGLKDKPGTKPPEGYKKIRVHLVFAVKHDGRHKARLVADGHLTDVPIESVYSGVVSLRGLRTVLFIAELNGLESWTTDIGNAYLEAETKEKVYIVAGPEFGSLEGHILVVHKALYGLRSSGRRWGERLGDCLRSMGFLPCKAEPDIWMRQKGDFYEYIATYVDDLEIASDDPKSIIDALVITHGFKLKGTGPIEFYLGCDFGRDEDGTLFMQPKKYIERMKKNYEQFFGQKVISTYRSPIEKGDHPETDSSDFLDAEGIQVYQSLIGSLQWAVSLARFDIATAVMTLSSFRVAPRAGHLERAKRVVCYLAKFTHAKLRFRTQEPDYSGIPNITYDWAHSVYGDIEEDIPDDIPTPLGKHVRITHYVDANLYHDKITGRSVTGILDYLNQTPIDWYSKKQATVETATYGSEFVASRTCVERDIDLRTLLRYLGVPIRKTTFMFGDNESVVNSSSTPHAKLHKRHTALSFHRVREAIAAKIVRYHHINSEHNPADILSKHWGHNQVWPLLNCVLFYSGDTIGLLDLDGEYQNGERNHVTTRQHGE